MNSNAIKPIKPSVGDAALIPQVTSVEVRYLQAPRHWDRVGTVTLTNVRLRDMDLSACGNIISMKFGPLDVAGGDADDLWNMMKRHAAQMRTLSTMTFRQRIEDCSLIERLWRHLNNHRLDLEMSNHQNADFGFIHYSTYAGRPQRDLSTYMQSLVDKRATEAQDMGETD
jgi:hypothetical protein